MGKKAYIAQERRERGERERLQQPQLQRQYGY